MRLTQVLAFSTFFVCSGCGVNRTRPIEFEHSHLLSQPAIILFGARSPNPAAPETLSFAHVTKNGGIVGAGCFLYDHVEAVVKAGKDRVTYYAYEVPAGLYSIELRSGTACDDVHNAWISPSCSAFPKAFYISQGTVWYAGTYEFKKVRSPRDETAVFDVIYPVDNGLSEAAQWARGRFQEPLRQATSSPTTPVASPFVCTP